jgi:hypothetical protein
MNVNEHGGYKIGTKVGLIKGYMSRNQVQFFANATLDVSEVPDRALFRARLMSIFAISDKLSLESTGGISRGFMQEGVMAIPASLTQLNSLTMVSGSN